MISLGGASSRHANLASPPVVAVNPLHERLNRQLADYHSEWGSLPQTAVSKGRTLSIGSGGERVEELRARLGLAAGQGYDAAVAARVADFQRAHGLPATGRADTETVAALNRGAAWYERLIRLNLARTRALPADPGRRYLIVDLPAARLWLYEDGRPVDSMRVVVGKQDQQTPEMAGTIRYMVFSPYWNLPPDIARDRIAPLALRYGPGWVSTAGYEVLSGWTKDARPIEPEAVDWRAVASGAQLVRVRQRPGPTNMMGRVKFMFPNRQGIYLHDTPHRRDFSRKTPAASAGCVRVENAARLARWLAGVTLEAATGVPEQRVDLPAPVPVYIVYLTAAPGEQGVDFRPDIYGRDERLIAQAAPGMPG